jgi:DNA polymerase III epsilon subunit-like protein
MNTEIDYPVYFSVDVETSGLLPSNGELLTVGAVAVTASGHIIDQFYVRIDRKVMLHESWYNENLPPQSETQEWWRSQDAFVKAEAYGGVKLERHPISTAAHMFRNWVISVGGDDAKNRIFVANPVSFDKMWISAMFMATQMNDPFHYRTLCLRSMAFGKDKDVTDFHSNDLRSNRPTHPHHALSDAYAQAQDLLELLGLPATDPLDEPTYDNAPGPFDDVEEEAAAPPKVAKSEWPSDEDQSPEATAKRRELKGRAHPQTPPTPPVKKKALAKKAAPKRKTATSKKEQADLLHKLDTLLGQESDGKA